MHSLRVSYMHAIHFNHSHSPPPTLPGSLPMVPPNFMSLSIYIPLNLISAALVHTGVGSSTGHTPKEN